ncbi:protease SohB [Pseudoalteromonas denitrificans]|uniref:Serine protease SohB n=1 Tax=Pseudoalteromonas denitrificans DSM 6059 TaxID=1123010 RepID=A0A1I1QTQ5_9GAMM|nr:protease SohB [Pseudoalteromonas denitrificans]SFD25496.1 serine protease SohB [Pseudoalteromonas denitrificans DSM 6059]
MEFLYEYGLFLAKALTFVIAIGAIIALIAGAAHKPKPKRGEIELDDISEQLDTFKESFLQGTLNKDALKKHNKEQKRIAKESEDKEKSKLYVLDFNGSMDAHEVSELREEITAILTIANPEKDKVLLRLESGGGVVHGYGLAASQLQRIKDAGINLTVCVDKVAASGGYMMACVADKLISAPFAIIGSIGVIAQIPNFNKILKKNDIDFEQITAGEFKRTLTIFGENTDKAREKFSDEIEETHVLFKNFINEQRPSLDLPLVATGEHWFGTAALEKGLVDELSTSDDVLLKYNIENQIYKVKFTIKKPLSEKFAIGLSSSVERIFVSLYSKVRASFISK